MRIIGGTFKGRKFNPPANSWPTRPTTDFSKESLYNILNNKVEWESMVMLDLFGGTGSHCYECISRGCQDATYVDSFAPAVEFVKHVSNQLDINSLLHVYKTDVIKFISQNSRKYTYIFADPPYEWAKVQQLPDMIFHHDILEKEGYFVLEHEKKHTFQSHNRFVDQRKYGATILSFFQ